MKYLSLFSGIEAVSMAAKPLGWQPVGFSEIEKFPCAVLNHYYPDVPNLGDISKVTKEQVESLGQIDIVIGGFPCQDLSVAGKRKGLKNADGTNTRSGLFFKMMDVIRLAKPDFILLENVPGILSSNEGNDINLVLDEISDAGYIPDMDCTDAQYFGVAQRRKRIFILCESLNHGVRTRSESLKRAICITLMRLSQDALNAVADPSLPWANDWGAFASSDGVQKKMRFFGLNPELCPWQDLLEYLEEESPKSTPDSSNTAYADKIRQSAHGKQIEEGIKDTGCGKSPVTMENAESCLSMSCLWRFIWEENFTSKKEFTTLTPSSLTIDWKIFLFAKIVLIICRHIEAWINYSQCWSVAASYCLTALKEYINYARFTSQDLFTSMEWRIRWGNYVQQAESTGQSISNIGIESFGSILPLSESLSGDIAPRRTPRQRVAGTVRGGTENGSNEPHDKIACEVAPTISARTKGGGGLGTDFDCDGGVIPIQEIEPIPFDTQQITSKTNRTKAELGLPSSTLNQNGNMHIAMPEPIAFPSTLSGTQCVESSETSYSIGTQAPGIAIPIGIDGQDIGFALRATASHSGDKGDGGVNTSMVVETVSAPLTGNPYADNESRESLLVPTVLAHGQGNAEQVSDGSPSLTCNHEAPIGFIPDLTGCSEPDTICHADAIETDASKTLRVLRNEIGEEAFSEWGLGILAAFLPPEVLQSAVHGKSIRCPSVKEFGLVNNSRSCAEDCAERIMRTVRETKREGCSPLGLGPYKQRAAELAAYLQELSQQDSPAKKTLCDLWVASEGPGLLRNPLSKVQEMGESEHGEGQSIHSTEKGLGIKPAKAILQSAELWQAISRSWTMFKARDAAKTGQVKWAVRRLTVKECLRLQGFPDSFFDFLYRGKKPADSPCYKALGNSMAVPNIRWILKRIELVSGL